jgi:hypothetical protein
MWDQFGWYHHWGGDEVDDYIRHLLRPETSDCDCLLAVDFCRNIGAVIKEELLYRLGAWVLALAIGHTASALLWAGAAFALMHNWYAWRRWSRREHLTIFVKCFINGVLYYAILVNDKYSLPRNFLASLLAHFLYNHFNHSLTACIAMIIVKHLRLRLDANNTPESISLRHIRSLRTLTSLERFRPLCFNNKIKGPL